MQRKQYSSQFVDNLVRCVLDEGQQLTLAAKNAGVHPGVLSKWVKTRRNQRMASPIEYCNPIPSDELSTMKRRVDLLEDRVESLRSILQKLLEKKYSSR